MTSMLSIAFSLFILMDPIGNIPVFLAVLKKIPPRRQLVIIFRELVIALLIIMLFYFVGDYILQSFRVSQDTVMIAGGIILFLVALKMIFPSAKDMHDQEIHEKEPFLVPLAIPMVAGPAVLAAVMLYSHQAPGHIMMLCAIVLAWVVSTLILLSSAFLKKILGWRGITACERLMGLILTLIAIQMFLEGLHSFLGRA